MAGMAGLPTLRFDGDDALEVGDLRLEEGPGMVVVLSQCVTSPSTESWPRLITAAPDGGVPWTSPGWQMVAPHSSATGGSVYSPRLSWSQQSGVSFEDVTIAARPDLQQAFRGEISAVLIFDHVLSTEERRRLDWYFDALYGLGSDSDGDGLFDSWERLHFSGSLNALPDGDSDQDGLGEADEQRWDTNPRDPSSGNQIRIASQAATATVTLSWLGSSARAYSLGATVDLQEGSLMPFVPEGGSIQGFDGPMRLDVLTSSAPAHRFFRVVVTAAVP